MNGQNTDLRKEIEGAKLEAGFIDINGGSAYKS